MECYEGATMIKTFRGLIVNGGQDTIVLHTNDGSTGYKIVKFEIFGNKPGISNPVENIVKILKVKETTLITSGAEIDFSDQKLLGVALWTMGETTYSQDTTVVFDGEVFNQDIYITNTDNAASEACNYYLELEQVKLDLGENTVATLKNIRNLEPGQI